MADEKTPATAWGYGEYEDSEGWCGKCATREEAIKEGREYYARRRDLRGSEDTKTFWIMSGTIPAASQFVPDAQWVLEHMGEAAAEEGGEFTEDFPEVSAEGREELDQLLKAWADKHCPVTFWLGDGTAEEVPLKEP